MSTVISHSRTDFQTSRNTCQTYKFTSFHGDNIVISFRLLRWNVKDPRIGTKRFWLKLCTLYHVYGHFTFPHRSVIPLVSFAAFIWYVMESSPERNGCLKPEQHFFPIVLAVCLRSSDQINHMARNAEVT